MKIKKVEIQAFRAYDKVDDATFDFTSDSGKASNFVTLYAPNGFGKTSFYDAVEWGVTNNISRFLRKKSENKSAARAEKNKYIWRHNNSDDDTPSFVKISTDEVNNQFERYLCHKIKSNQRDAKFDEKLTDKDNDYFLDVMLSQEEIASFLKEDDSGLRYEKFINAFGDKDLDKKYKKLTELISFNKLKIKEISLRQGELKELLKDNVDKHIISKINHKISDVNKFGLSIPNIQPNYNEQSDSNLKFEIIDVVNKIDSDLSNLEGIVSTIDEFLDSKNSESLVEYENDRNKLKSIDKEIEYNKIKISNLDKLTILERKLEEFTLRHNTKAINLSEFEYLENNLTRLDDLRSSFLSKKDELEKINRTLIEDKEIESNINKLIKEDTRKKHILNENRNKLITQLESSKYIYKSHDIKTKLLESQKKEYSKLRSEFEDVRKKEKELLTVVERWSYFYKKIESNIFEDSLLEYLPNLSDSFIEIKKIRSELPTLKTELTISNGKLQDSEVLDKSLNELVDKATEVISKKSLHQCPLCSAEHGDISSLLYAIKSNNLIGSISKELVEENNEIYNKYVLAQEVLKGHVNEIKSSLNSLMEERSNEINSFKRLRIDLINKVQDKENKIKVTQSLIDGFRNETQMKNIDDYEFALNDDIDSLELDITSLNSKIKVNRDRVDSTIIKVEMGEVSKKLIEEQMDVLRNDSFILSFSKFTGSKNPFTIQSLDLTEAKNKVSYEFEQSKSDIFKTELVMSDIKVKYNEFDKEKSHEVVTLLEKQKNEVESRVKVVKAFVDSFVEIKLDKNKDLTSEVLSAKAKYLSSIKDKKSLVFDIRTIGEYREGVIPFLKHSEYLVEYNSNIEELDLLNNIMGKELDKERKKISSFIDRGIKSFFYQDLINSFYQKIDPHPKYKDISFKCDFSNDKPRLYVIVASEESKIVPTLYFSSAQLNVLSLSIFLAKAINVKNPETGKDVNTIFVDDPIQAMDSINVLSVIDLLRSITVNFDKQIILSTHDENFFQLIKKKVPEHIFASKFIELESYGKVNREDQSVYSW
ncbi:AAA family ATPase [Photobacterium sanguinicancri]|uniref:AAA family ATPase n=1 Tax=Photobacterium sanguinicancri TaxID=875932 RepID=A0AAW7YEF3_9GAMM|nr:AAA family ATPase [Photobacterium sanguinicancri]MDO6545208.1 AAA family ATPase [Photobacterium sanguinicancri]